MTDNHNCNKYSTVSVGWCNVYNCDHAVSYEETDISHAY